MYKLEMYVCILTDMVRLAVSEFGHDDNYWIKAFQTTSVFDLMMDTSLDLWKESTESLYNKAMEELGAW